MFYGEIRENIPVVSLLFFFIWSMRRCVKDLEVSFLFH